jgi:hypothetical protein
VENAAGNPMPKQCEGEKIHIGSCNL